MVDFKYELVIMTTAINRPEMHSEIFPDILEWINPLKVKWFINIDVVHEGVSGEDTKNNFIEMFTDKSFIDYDITINNNPCFYSTVKSLTNKIDKMIDEVQYGLLMLEDDWPLKVDPNIADLKVAIKNHLVEDYDYISFKNRDQLNFNPSVWTKTMFRTNFVDGFRLNKYEPRDPELTVGDAAWLDGEGTRHELPSPRRIVKFDWFESDEYGREWLKNNMKKQKWNKWNKGTDHSPLKKLTYID